MEESHTFVDNIRLEQEVEKKRGHFALNYLPYNPVGSLSHLDIHHPSFNPPRDDQLLAFTVESSQR